MAQKGAAFGLGAMTITLLIWASFFISLRSSHQSALAIGDIALFRFLPAALLFGWLSRHSLAQIWNVPKRYLFAIGFGAGLPFLLLAANGLKLAPVSHGASLIPGILPLFVSGIAFLIYKESISAMRRAGIVLIFLGIVFFLFHSLTHSTIHILQGQLLLVAASVSWAWFTIGMRVSGLNAVQGGAVLSISALIMLMVGFALGWLDSNISSAPLDELGFHFLIQGIAVGIAANYSYAFAISKLGAEASAALGSLTPVIASLLAFFAFNEQLTLNTGFAIGLIVIGAVMASEVIKLRFRKDRKPVPIQ